MFLDRVIVVFLDNFNNRNPPFRPYSTKFPTIRLSNPQILTISVLSNRNYNNFHLKKTKIWQKVTFSD